MNLQTETLAKQAAEYAIEFATQDQELYIPKLMEKFAELIVKETITEMCQQLYWHGEDQSNNPSFYKAIDKTKKHFGVEE